MKKLASIIIFLLTLSSLDAERVYSNNPPLGKVYTYKEVDGVTREMEIYFPKGHDSSKKTVPGILLFHGGGWGGGTRVMFSYQCNYFASRGLVAATVSYRLATKAEKQSMRGEKSFKRFCITDAKSAIRWYKQNADELGIDPKRIIAGGGSAGGHISLLATTTPGLNDPNDPKGYDTSVAAYLLFNPALSGGDAKDPEVDFLQQLKADFPPSIAFFGSEDPRMKKGWIPAYEKMKSLGIKSVDFRVAEGLGHGFFNSQPWADITLIEADRFLHDLGFLKGDPTLQMPKSGEQLKDANKTLDPTR
ncbi:MAG: alpha/beta hydrolase fold domain-containing protein [Opitutales bacterium]|nr:alpha/beta hydrolase fold domain-containing protein [Opitutales bacterium]